MEKFSHLTDDAIRQYGTWLQEAFDGAAGYLGTEEEPFLDPLISMENFLRELYGQSYIRHRLSLERAFARAAGYKDNQPAGIDDILGLAVKSFRRAVDESANSIEAMAELLARAGAKIIRNEGPDFIPTQPSGLKAPQSVEPRRYKQRLQPRLAWLVEGLRDISIYPEDLIIHLRKKDPDKMKKVPHVLVEIPRLNCQIAVCDQVGEVTFVADQRFELPMWEILNKYQLKTLLGVTPVILRDKDTWLTHIKNLLMAGAPAHRAKVNVLAEGENPKRTRMPYSVALIVESLIACYDPNTGAYPSMKTGIILKGPLANGQRTWSSVNQAIRLIHQRDPEGNFVYQSMNGLTRDNCPYKSLAELKTASGLTSDDTYTVEDIVASLIACRDPVTGAYPSMKTGIILKGPLANGQRTWHSVEQALRWIHADGNVGASSNGLTKEICPYGSLAALKRAHGLINDYTVSDIIESLIACRDPETGAYPSMNTGIILKGPLANGQRTWSSVEQSIRLIHQRDPEGNFVRQSMNGLTRDNCPYKSLAELKNANGLNGNSLMPVRTP